MRTIKKPPVEGPRAETSVNICYQNMPLSFSCQAHSPISCLIRSVFIESLVSKRYTCERSLKVDGLLLIAEFLEVAGYECN
jgi:hypothetical protein